MTNEASLHWAGVDWGDQSHALVVVNAEGKPVASLVIPHSAEGLELLVATLREHGPIAGVAIECTRHLLIDKLLEAAFPVYPINPKIATTWREHLKVDPAKDDTGDGLSLGYHLRLYHAELTPLRPDDPLTRQLRLLCQDEQSFIAERTAAANRLKDGLKQYYPQALEWFPQFTTPTAVAFLLAFPTPAELDAASDNELWAFLHGRHIGRTPAWRRRVAQRGQGPAWPRDEATRAAKSLYAASLARHIQGLNATLDVYRRRIEALFAQHPDAPLFASLPGAGPKLAPRLLTHFGTDRRRFPDAAGLQALSGTVPVTKRSGKAHHVSFRWACQKDFRNTLFFFAFQTLKRSPWARALYDRCRQRGQTHSGALRNLGAKWLKILLRMWHEHTLYDERTYLHSLAEHGSPLVAHMQTSEKCGELMKKLLT